MHLPYNLRTQRCVFIPLEADHDLSSDSYSYFLEYAFYFHLHDTRHRGYKPLTGLICLLYQTSMHEAGGVLP